jgi:putative ABC transport system substrate-binding protein
VLPSPATVFHRHEIIALTMQRHLPAVFPYPYFAAEGGLMSYGVDQVDQWTRAAAYITRILGGENPGTLPVQQPNQFELVVNLKTAKTLGLSPPLTLLARVNKVIE